MVKNNVIQPSVNTHIIVTPYNNAIIETSSIQDVLITRETDTEIIAQGTPGVRGASAYEIAIKNGFTGSEEEWLSSLVGSDGAVGPTGPVGPKGDIGPVGPTGPQGIQGPAGLKGDKGDIGDIGPKGEQGIQGIQGLKGDAGPKGAKGDTGEQGPTGPAGPQGEQGPKGDKGEPGSSGVYIGVDEPVDAHINVWIDPTGMPNIVDGDNEVY